MSFLGVPWTGACRVQTIPKNVHKGCWGEAKQQEERTEFNISSFWISLHTNNMQTGWDCQQGQSWLVPLASAKQVEIKTFSIFSSLLLDVWLRLMSAKIWHCVWQSYDEVMTQYEAPLHFNFISAVVEAEVPANINFDIFILKLNCGEYQIGLVNWAAEGISCFFLGFGGTIVWGYLSFSPPQHSFWATPQI